MAKPKVDVVLIRADKLKKLGAGLIDLDRNKLKDMLEASEQFAGKFQNLVRIQAPRHKGKFRNALDVVVRKSGPNVGEIKLTYKPGADRPKDLIYWIIKGTGIYGKHKRRIRPKKAPFLVWRDWRGQWHRKRSVRGMKPRDFVGDTLEAMDSAKEQLRERVGKFVIKRLF